MASEQDIFCETQLAVIIDDLARNFDNNEPHLRWSNPREECQNLWTSEI
jgi:hypothetical protein